jgi:hypothetical protein
MVRTARVLALLSLLSFLSLAGFHRDAVAGIPSPGNTTISNTRINLVGWNGTTSADSTEINSKVTITVRDVANDPVSGIPVVLDFSACGPEIKIAGTQHYHALTTNCPSGAVQDYSTQNGTVSFVVTGGITNRTSHAAGCCKILIDSYLVGSLNVGAFDQNNLAGMTLADVSFFWADNGSSAERSNVNDSQTAPTVTLADVAFAWAANGKFRASGASLCP